MQELIIQGIHQIHRECRKPQGILMHEKDLKKMWEDNWINLGLPVPKVKKGSHACFMGIKVYMTKDIERGTVKVF